jgi:hypothetical protein
LLCDSAADYGGKVSILGGFVSLIYVQTFPTPAPIQFAGRVAFTNEEARQPHTVVIRAKNPEDEVIAEVRGEIPPGDPSNLPAPELMGGLNVVVPMPFPIAGPGLFQVEFLVDDLLFVSLPVKVTDQIPG